MAGRLTALSPYALALLRIVAALLFMEHGLMKLFHFPAPQPAPQIRYRHFFGRRALRGDRGPLVALGLLHETGRVSPVRRDGGRLLDGARAAQLLAGINQGDAAILFCFIFFYLGFAGAGALSLDGALSRSKTSAA